MSDSSQTPSRASRCEDPRTFGLTPHLASPRDLKQQNSAMTSFGALLSKWPLVRQIREGKDGTGLESMSDKTRAMHARIDNAQVARSVCPYCGVGCGQLIYHKNGKLISVEGDPESPISQGNLCPKGAASYQLLTHD